MPRLNERDQSLCPPSANRRQASSKRLGERQVAMEQGLVARGSCSVAVGLFRVSSRRVNMGWHALVGDRLLLGQVAGGG